MAPKSEPPPRRPIIAELNSPNLKQTSIDRRTCHRTVPMQVMSFGVSRTGTCSMRQALLDLGYEDCYHFGSVLQENPRDADMWVEAMEAKFEGKGKPFTRNDWDQLLGHCRALTDTPCAVFYRELLSAYPDAKILLTVRDSPEQWFESQMRTIIPFFENMVLPPQTWTTWLKRKFMPAQPSFDRLNELLAYNYEMYTLLIYDAQHGTKKALEWYEEYVKEIQRIVPKERLLVMNVKEGWEPLCRFLGKEVPGWEFPKVNTTDDWYKHVGAWGQAVDQMVYWRMVKTFGAVAVGVVGVAVYAFNKR